MTWIDMTRQPTGPYWTLAKAETDAAVVKAGGDKFSFNLMRVGVVFVISKNGGFL